eukprot:jgi/Chlat1/6547/Chrsp45S06019
MSYNEEEEVPAGRPKLNLAPRSANAEAGARGGSSGKPNPFGAARPREAIMAERQGKSEREILQEQAVKEWQPRVTLTEAQYEEKKAAESEIAFARNEMENEPDAAKKAVLEQELTMREDKYRELLANFEAMALQKAATAPRPSERRAEREAREGGGGGRGGYGGGDDRAGYGAGGYGAGAGGGGREGYGDAWGGKRGAGGGGGQVCYTCNETGHISRECPQKQAGGYGGGYGSGYGGGGGAPRRGGGQQCYNCGEDGHISRECPNPRSADAGSYGRGGGGGSYGDSYGSRGYGDRGGGGGYGGSYGGTGGSGYGQYQ